MPNSLFVRPSKIQMMLLIGLVFFSPLAIDLYIPALPIIAANLKITPTLAQDTITLFLFSLGLGQLFAGPLADKLGRRRIALMGIALYVVSALLAYFAPTIEWLLTARFLQGLGACATSVAAFATVRDVFGPARSGKMISYLNGAVCFIPALAPILGSWLTQQFGWRTNFSFMALFGFVIGVLVWTKMKETNPKMATEPVFAPSRYWSVLKEPMFLFHAILCLLAMAVILAYVTSAPIVLMDNLHLTMNEFTHWFALNAVCNIIAAFSAPKFMERYGTRYSLIVGIVATAVAGIMMLIFEHIAHAWAFMVPIFISSIGFAWILGAAAGKALAPFGDRAGTAAALLGLFQMSGSGAMVALMQRLPLSPQHILAVQMLILLPALAVLFSKVGYKWHSVADK